MNDIGFTHVALLVTDINKSLAFYQCYANMSVIHRRTDATSGRTVVWLSDKTRPFVLVLGESEQVNVVLSPFAHLGIGCKSRADVDVLCDQARDEGVLLDGPHDRGYPVGYWAFLRDPDGHTLEISYGQELGLTVQQAQDNAPGF